jgi:hypothetical protein
MSRTLATRFASLALPVTLLLPGCAGMGSIADIVASAGGIYGAGNGDRSGQITSIDTRRQEIQLSSGWGGSQRIRYDNRTEVLDGSRRSSVRNLSRGDQVRVNVDTDRNGSLYARRIQVQQTTIGGVNRGSRIQRIDGEVGRIDTQRGSFELYQNRTTLLVTLPYQPDRNIRDRFQRLRRGQQIRIEGEMLNAGRVELVRFM